MTSMIEKVAKAIYWGAYDEYSVRLNPNHRHPHNFTKDRAWNATSPEQRDFCRHQAACAMNALNVVEP